jgi:hypothetical protein
VAIDGGAAAGWVACARGPKRLLAAALVPMTIAAAASLSAAGPFLGTTIR